MKKRNRHACFRSLFYPLKAQYVYFIAFFDYLETLKVVWNKKYFMVSRAVNRHVVEDRRISLWKKMCTFEGPSYLAKEDSVNSPLLTQRLRKMADDIVEHILGISGGLITIHKMELFFRIDDNNKIWLIYCPRIEIKTESEVFQRKKKCSKKSSNTQNNQAPPDSICSKLLIR